MRLLLPTLFRPWALRLLFGSGATLIAVAAAAALGLGATGFAIGCLYASLTAVPPPAPTAVDAGAPEVADRPATSAPGKLPMGGPYEAAFTGTSGLHLGDGFRSARLPGPYAPAGAAARGRVERPNGGGSDVTAGKPTLRPVLGGWVSSSYGQRDDPFTGEPAPHRGLDFAGLDNSAIMASGAGVVTWSGHRDGYGNLIEIDHGNGWVTRYGHNAANLVTVGDYVRPGQTIALMGATGRATGTHLHFEIIHDGLHLNPVRVIPHAT